MISTIVDVGVSCLPGLNIYHYATKNRDAVAELTNLNLQLNVETRVAKEFNFLSPEENMQLYNQEQDTSAKCKYNAKRLFRGGVVFPVLASITAIAFGALGLSCALATSAVITFLFLRYSRMICENFFFKDIEELYEQKKVQTNLELDNVQFSTIARCTRFIFGTPKIISSLA